ncbi:MAG: hypothetical protein KA072_00140 [Thermoanaerobaculaceae bacterium]|nr:hypothetical protein [Thermoanaerobaculaceae bacterium]MDI9621340.1 glycosyl transferase [Acidobacteriota bacterium]NLH12446.1 glycosyl transferase [Holophagae bacterium]HPW54128.1 hypothetical protein [Thermoanaerobaculaceae bacterium]
MLHFCTYFDCRYLDRGLALHASLTRTCPEFHLSILCLDAETDGRLRELGLGSVELIRLCDLEGHYPQLAAAKASRSRIEHYFTCTPFLISLVLESQKHGEVATYLDADLFFFSDPSTLLEELGTGSAAIIAHRFPERLRRLEAFGRFNVGWVSIRNDSQGWDCATWWRDRCAEWCYDRVEGNRFADQRYLDEWPSRFPGTVVISHPGANLAPWNLASHRVRVRPTAVTVDSRPLIFFHFHGLRRILGDVWDMNLAAYDVRPGWSFIWRVYGTYLRELRRASALVSPLLPSQAGELRTAVGAHRHLPLGGDGNADQVGLVARIRKAALLTRAIAGRRVAVRLLGGAI